MTAVATETEPETDAEVRWFPSVEAMVMAYHDEWAYLFKDLPVRPPTEDEAAAYAARHGDAAWDEIYNPDPEPRIQPRPVPVPGHYIPEPEPDEDTVRAAALAQHQEASVADLGRWTGGKALADDPKTDEAATRFIEAFKADPEGDADRAPLPEIHHEGGEA